MRSIRSRTLVFLLLAGILTGISIQTGHAQLVHAYIDPGHGGVPPDPYADPGYPTIWCYWAPYRLYILTACRTSS